jgi:hypothetical protein
MLLTLAEGLAATEQQVALWQPHPDNIPQQLAYECEADELFYGGAAGGGKTDLLLGLAATQHHTSIIFRRVFPSMRAIVERSREILNPDGQTRARDSYNESSHRWMFADGRLLEFGHIQHEKNVTDYQGRPHDFYGWDELPEFSEYMFRFVNAWNRTTRPRQRCRIVATGNPPTTAEGEWVIRYWSPWLDPAHPNPADSGELRWFVVIDGEDVEVDGPEPIEHEDEWLIPRSRTFIPAKVGDNPFLAHTGYVATLQGLPEPLRTQLLYGDFTIGLQDDPWQVIPSQWVIDAQNRWGERSPVALRAVGVDVAHGGKDQTVIAKLYANYFDEMIVYPGETTPRGEDVARYVMRAMESKAPIYIDAIGYGASAHERLDDMTGVEVHGVNVGGRTNATDQTGMYEFANIRSEAYWRLREALDPESGENIALPPSRELRVDLTAPRYTIRAGKYALEKKEDIIKRTGYSPDMGDAVALAWWGVSRNVKRPAVKRARSIPAPGAKQKGRDRRLW